MKLQIEDSWINHKCSECGKLIYPEKVYKVKSEMERTSGTGWRFCKKCYNEIFKNDK